MTALSDRTLSSILDRALTETIGIYIRTNNPSYMIALLGKARRDGGPQYEPLMFCRPSTPDTVFIVKKSVELD